MPSVRYLASKTKPVFSIGSRRRLNQSTNLGVAAMATISQAVTNDHRELEHCYHQIINSTDHDHQERYGNQFTWELARHSAGEELVVYPAFEKHMGMRGHNMAEIDRKEHHHVSHTLRFPPLTPFPAAY